MLLSNSGFGFLRPLRHARIAEFAHLSNQQGLHLIRTPDLSILRITNLQDRFKPFQQFRMLAQLGQTLDFLFGEFDAFFGHPYLKLGKLIKVQIIISSHPLLITPGMRPRLSPIS